MSEAEAATTAALWLPMLAGIVGVMLANVAICVYYGRRKRQTTTTTKGKLYA